MKKSLIALAVASVFAAPAMADEVKVYGKADMGFGSVNNGTGSAVQISSQVTKLGFKGSEDMGNGMSAIWQIEQQIDIDGTTTGGGNHFTFAGRNSFLGLKSDAAGTVLMGRHDTPYKIATRKLDVFGDQMADNRALLGGNGGGFHDMRAAEALAYMSPKLGGMATIAAAYIAGAEIPAAAGAVKGSGYSLAGMFDIGPVYATVAYQTVTYGSAGTGTLATPGAAYLPNDSTKATKIGVGYTVMEGLNVNAVYEKISTNGTGTSAINNAGGRTDVYVAAAYKFTDTDGVKVAYGKAGNNGNTSNTSATQVSAGYEHDLSKNTNVYVQYTSIKNGAAAKYGISTAGTTMQNGTIVAGNTVTGMMLGVKHSF